MGGDPAATSQVLAHSDPERRKNAAIGKHPLEREGARQARDLTAVARQDPADLADAAFATMGRRVMAERGLAVDEGGLTELVEAMARPPALDDDELGHYTALVELAAATGEVLRARFGGRWVRDLRPAA